MSPFLSDALLRTQSDERLAALAAAGRGRAFEVLVERHRRSLLVFARHAVGAGRAEDVVQQALLQAWRSLQAGAEVEHVRGWLHQIVRHAAWRAARAAADERLPDGLVGSAGPQDEVERRMEVSAVVASLAAMPERQRAAIVQTVLEGQSQREVAASLGLSEGAVRQLVHRGRSFLRATATAVVPMPLVNWAAGLGSGAGAPVGERVAEGVAGAGSAGVIALLAKGGAALVAAGAVATGVATQAIHHQHRHGPVAPASAAAAASDEARLPVSLSSDTVQGSEADDRSDGGRDHGSGRGRRRDRRGDGGRHHGNRSGTSGSRHHRSGGDHSGSGSGSGSGDRSTSGSGDDHSGSGRSGDDRSGSTSGSGSGSTSTSGRSGSGSDDGRSTSGSGSGDDRSGSTSGSDDGSTSGSDGGSTSGPDGGSTSGSDGGSTSGSDGGSTSGSGSGSTSGSGDDRSLSGSGDGGSGSGS